VSFIVLQKSKSCVWHRGSASTVKSGAGVHGCLGRCRSLRPTSGANVAVEGTQGNVSWRQNHGTLPARSRGTERGFAGAASGFGPGSRESSLRWKALWIVDAEDLHGAFARSGLGLANGAVASIREAADSLRIDRGVRDSIGARCARKKNASFQRSARSVSARSRVVKRGAVR